MRSKFKWIFTLIMAFSMQFSFAQEKTVTGVVSDALGPLAGANVVVQGTINGATTDFDGNYSIKTKQGDVLVFTYTGMKKATATVGASNAINMTMQEDILTGSEVVVTGALGIKRKAEEVTSSYQVVGNKELTQASNPNVVQSLAGKVSGLQINNTSNGVNASTRIVLRGNRSVSGNNQALVVIDNAISSASVLQQLPPSVIESVNVLKGSQGAALYGEQGVNGVIIVSTKKGVKGGKMVVNVNSSIDFEQIAFLPKRQTRYGQGWFDDQGFDIGDGNGDTSHIPWENGGWGPAFNDPRFAGTLQPVGLPQADGTFVMSPWAPIEDNIKEFFKTGHVYQNGINVNMGTDDSYAMLSYNRQNTDFVVLGDELVRNSFGFKAGKKFGKFSLDGNVNYITQTTSQTTPGLFGQLLQTATNIPIERFSAGANEHHWTVYYDSPYWERDAKRFDNKNDYISGIANIGYEVNKHINVSYLASVRLNSANSQSHVDGFSNVNYDYTNAFANAGYTYYGDTNYTFGDLGGHGTTSAYYADQSSFRNFYGDLLINFDYDLTKDLNFKLNLGNNIQDNLYRITSQGGTNLDTPGWYHINNVLSPDLPATLDNRVVRSRKVAFFGNLDLGFRDYLFLNSTLRWEKSSTVLDASLYPSVGLSFVPTKAFDALRGDVLNFAKVYANYVKVGNTSNVNAYDTDAVGVIPTGFPFGSLSSFQVNSSPTDKFIEPEYVNTTEFGVNLGFFNNRITLDASAYSQKTTNLVTFATTSSGSGLGRSKSNVGDLENKGFEIDLGLTPIKLDNSFRWDIRGSYATSKTKVLKLAEGANSVNLQSNTFIGIFAEVGEEFPLIKGTVYERDPNGNVIVNANGDPVRSSDFRKLGKATPDYTLGLSNSFEYKGVKLTAVADYRTGHQFYSGTKRELSWSGHLLESADFDRSLGYVIPGSVQETSPGVYTANTTPVQNDAGYSGVLNYYSNIYSTTGENFVLDATTLTIRELALSYALPTKLIENTGITSFTIGVNARNPFIFFASENQNFANPESSNTTGNAQGISNIGRYPSTKTYGVSLNLTF